MKGIWTMLFLRNKLRDISGFIATALLGCMMVDIFLQVFTRYVLNSPMTWTEELARYLYGWVTFISGGYCVYEHLHIEMTIVREALPAPVSKILKILCYLFSAFCYGYIVPAGIKFTIMQNKVPSVSLPMKMSLLWIAIPLGSALLALAFLIESYFIIKEWNAPTEKK